MEPIILVEGRDLEALKNALSDPGREVHSLRVAIDGNCVKFKINQGTWHFMKGIQNYER